MERKNSAKPALARPDQLDAISVNVTSTVTELDAPPSPSHVSICSSIDVEIDRYDTNHPKRGIALIFNQVQFKSMSRRDSSDRDRDSMSSVLSRIGFDVRVFNDLKRKELLAELESVAAEDHSQNDCLVVVVMTHGKAKNHLYASDTCYKAKKLWEPFIGNECPSLRGKPKLFFIQACRGEKLDNGAIVRVRRMITEKSEKGEISYVIPTMADLLVMYSTYDGHYSWRNPDDGSWFIQSLSYELRANVHRLELLHILTAVSRRVAYEYQSNVPYNEKLNAKKQMPCIVSMLTKLLYFQQQQ
uniref:Caspase n=1 Tax=Anopheles culicifacies TaxID=139723 RepID=A0A182LSD5_9DIPT